MAIAIDKKQYTEIIETMRKGSVFFKPNPRVASVLIAEANLGMRVGDILRLRLCDIIREGKRYRLNMVEEKTGKKRTFTVPEGFYRFLEAYAEENGIRRDERLFPISERAVQKQLKLVCDYLGLEGVSTHSFRKWYATDIYEASGHDIILVQTLLQHSSPMTTRRYIGLSDARVEDAIQAHLCIV